MQLFFHQVQCKLQEPFSLHWTYKVLSFKFEIYADIKLNKPFWKDYYLILDRSKKDLTFWWKSDPKSGA